MCVRGCKLLLGMCMARNGRCVHEWKDTIDVYGREQSMCVCVCVVVYSQRDSGGLDVCVSGCILLKWVPVWPGKGWRVCVAE